MERLRDSLWVRLTSGVLVINAALLPLLYLGVSAIVQAGYAELFVSRVRSDSRLVADELEALDERDLTRRVLSLLDALVVGGQAITAEVVDGSHVLTSPLSLVPPEHYRQDDFEFADHGDQIYYISHAVKRAGRSVTLRIGYDESPTLERIAAAKRRVLAAMLCFILASVAAAISLSRVIARPLVRLQDAAQRVAGGEYHAPLQVQSSIREVRELNHHLEQMRQELVGTNDRLQREIQEREASEQKRLELESRLRHQERIATIGTLAGGIAHEINNIMTPLLLYAQMALQDAAAAGAGGVADDLRRIIAAAHRARSVVTRVLTFSREMDMLESRVFPPGPIIEEALALIRGTVPANIEIEHELQVADACVLGDPSQLHQVAVNLFTNASQAMRAEGGRLFVDLFLAERPAESRLAPGRYIVLEVRDTGHGMDEQVMAHIFEPFFTTREVGEGTGLGLSVVHGIVTSMGGAISADSTPGRGSVFRVYLPVASAMSDNSGVAVS